MKKKKILVTGDDGIFAKGLWALVDGLKSSFDVVVVAPDRKQNAVGISATVDRPFRAKKLNIMSTDIETWAVEGTPLDSVFLGINKLFKDEVFLVVSGVNEGPNQNGDIYNSGTVAAALIASMAGLPALAISQDIGNIQLDTAAKLTTLLAKHIENKTWPSNVCLNINVPNLPPAEIKGIKVTRFVSSGIYIDGVVEDSGHSDKDHIVDSGFYWLTRKRVIKVTDRRTDIWAVQHGYISISSLHNLLNKPAPHISNELCSNLFTQFRER